MAHRTLLLPLFTLLLLTACATATPMESTRLSPSSEGKIMLDEGDANENNYVDVTVMHMAPPDRIGAQYTTYVVWLRPQGEDGWSNIGQLKIDDDRVGELRAPTPFRRFDVIITAEERSSVTAPSEAIILRGNVAEPD